MAFLGLNPEKLLTGLVAQMGVTPEDISKLLGAIVANCGQVAEMHAEMLIMRAEREAFKSGAGGVVAEFRATLARQEALLTRIIEGIEHGEETGRGEHVNGRSING